MNRFLQFFKMYSKGIIYCSVFAFIVAGIFTHQFDPYHPTLVTRECIQAPLLCSDKFTIFSILAIGVFLIRHLSGVRPSKRHLLPAGYSYRSRHTIPIGHPVLHALSRGRLQRRTYL